MSAALTSEGGNQAAAAALATRQHLAPRRERDDPTAATEAVVAEWRRKAVNVFAVASTAAYLPAVVMMVAGAAPPNGWPSQLILVGAYFCCVFCALLYRTNYRTRAWALLAAVYVVALIHLITIPQGPFAKVLASMLPILAIVVLGARAAWAVTVASIGLIFFGPLLQQVVGLVEMLTLEPAGAPTPTNVVFYQGVGLAASLVCQMILLDRFHSFLMRSLTSLQREAGERAAAYQRLEREMGERQRLEREMDNIRDNERRRLGQDLHDGVCQQVTAALLRCQALGRRLERGGELSGADFETVSGLLAESIDEAHNVARGLCPLDPEPESLVHALRSLVKRTREMSSVGCELVETGNLLVPDEEVAQHLYRIAQEALSNAVRHALASQITVELRQSEGYLTLLVEDDGIGLPAERPTEGMGLRIMAHRAQILNGDLSVTPSSAGGTRVACRIPFRRETTIEREIAGDIPWAPNT